MKWLGRGTGTLLILLYLLYLAVNGEAPIKKTGYPLSVAINEYGN
jgi:hypothetical protein